jgi:anti-sigma regulatory factor (Ser/Thr protein kinase)
MERVARAAAHAGLLPAQLARLQTAVAEATMNAIEHGNQFNPHLRVAIQVLQTSRKLIVRITDHGGGRPVPDAVPPNLEAKLEGLQSPRGWGLFLIQNMVDQMQTTTDETHHTVELTLYRWPAGDSAPLSTPADGAEDEAADVSPAAAASLPSPSPAPEL